MSNRREQIAGEVARWGENRARILTENIELDRKLTALGEQIVAAERSVLGAVSVKPCIAMRWL